MTNGDEPIPVPDRRPTDEMKPMRVDSLRMELDLADPSAVAEFLEAVAASIRAKRRIVLVVE